MAPRAGFDRCIRFSHEETAHLPDAALQELLLEADTANVLAARESSAAFVEYVLTHERDGSQISNAEFHREIHQTIAEHLQTLFVCPIEHGKAMPLDTPIPTPVGFRPMGELVDGDVVFGGDGAPCVVRRAWPVRLDRPVYEIELDDGERIRADAEHNWLAWSQDDLDEARAPRVVTTEQMLAAGLRRRTAWRWKLPVAGAAQYQAQDFAVHPYVLGAWLGDGDTDSAGFTCHEDDLAIVDRCVALDNGKRGTLRPDKRRPSTIRTVIGGDRDSVRGDSTLRSRLRALQVLGDKHIPEQYLRGSIEQRQELLAGLLDTDGSVCGERGQSRIEFGDTNERLATQVLELVRSLGFKATLISTRATLRGVDHGLVHRVCFTARTPVFRLTRKLAQQRLDGDRTRTRHRSVVAIRPVESVPVRCITVSSPDSTFLAGRGYTITHNTQQVAIGYVLWTLGRNPNARIALICDSKPQAMDRLGAVKKYIETSERLWRVFPHLRPAEGSDRPDPGESWSCESITIRRGHGVIAKEPSVQAFGTGSRELTGKRFDLMVFDDVLDFANTRTTEGCAKVIEWFDTTAQTRLVEGGRAIVIGTPWSSFDLLAELQKRKGWVCRRYAAVLNPDDPVKAWKPTWSEAWSIARLLERYENTPSLTFWRKYMCRITSDATSRFRAAWFANAKLLGRGRHFLKKQPVLLPQNTKMRCFTGVDLGNSPRKRKAHGSTDHGHGLTVIFTIAVDNRARRIVVNIESGRWTGPAILDRLHDTYVRYNSTIIVESNGVQDWIRQFAQYRAIPTVPFTTTAENKYDEVYGIESLAVELRNGLWVFPSGPDGKTVDPELLATEAELTAYNPEGHTGDRAMAMWFARGGATSLIQSMMQKLPTIPR